MEAFKVYIDRLKGGEVCALKGEFAPTFLEIDEPELKFHKPVAIKGEAYVTDDHLVVHFSAVAFAEMPCAVCNELFEYKLSCKDFYHTEPLSDIPSAVFEIGPVVREALLVELPHAAECNGGKCLKRDTITPYMRSEKRSSQSTHFPFSDIDLKN